MPFGISLKVRTAGAPLLPALRFELAPGSGHFGVCPGLGAAGAVLDRLARADRKNAAGIPEAAAFSLD
jgi:hypothetical protein